MVMDAVVKRCVQQSPVTVMARLALQQALEPGWVDELFERECGAQYTHELSFSTTVELMSVVAIGLRPSVHAAAKACKDLFHYRQFDPGGWHITSATCRIYWGTSST
jgi:hypothetical protein